MNRTYRPDTTNRPNHLHGSYHRDLVNRGRLLHDESIGRAIADLFRREKKVPPHHQGKTELGELKYS